MPTFPLKLQTGASGGPVFSTAIVRTDAEKERRNANWGDPRWAWKCSLTTDSADLGTLQSFFEARQGRRQAFMFLRPYRALTGESDLAAARFDQDELSYDFDTSPSVSVSFSEFPEAGATPYPTAESFPADSEETLALADTAGKQERSADYQTVILGENSVAEVREAVGSRRRRWTIQYAALSLAKLLELQDFFIARRGRAQSFLLELYDGSTVRVRFDRDSFDATYRPRPVGAVGELPLIEVLEFSPAATTGNPVRDYLRAEVTAICTLYTLTAKSGVQVRLCNATRPFRRGAGGSTGEVVTWTPSPIEKTETERVIGLDPDNVEILVPFMGAEFSLTRELFQRGLWDDASVEVESADYLTGLVVERRVFRAGDIRISRLGATLELRSLAALLNQERGDTYSPTCRVRRFADAECGLNALDFSYDTEIAEVLSATQVAVALDGSGAILSPVPVNDYARGELIFREGPMAGRRFEIKSSTASPPLALTLQLPLPFATEAGVGVTIVRGCDRTKARCRSFNNVVNFRGEPHVQSIVEMVQIERAR